MYTYTNMYAYIRIYLCIYAFACSNTSSKSDVLQNKVRKIHHI